MLWQGYDIDWTRRSNCRRMILTYVTAENRLRLSTPKKATVKDVEAFLQSRRGWIEEHMKPQDNWQPAYLPGEKHLLFGQYVTLGQGGVPAGERAFVKWRAEKLLEALRPMIPRWEARLGVKAKGLRIREMKSRWGSCQPVTGVVTLNLRLARVDMPLVEYVVAHELCHLLQADHSRAFHRLMDVNMPDWQVRKKQLNGADLRPQKG